ncbi:hypothetical protein T459_11573, partial [Capsicum annuum]
SIPSNVSGFQSLWSLMLSSNNWTGTIPSWITSLPSLKYLDLSNNNFNGQIEEFKSKELSWINLGNNHLQSAIPNSLLNQENLIFLSISSNNFSDNLNFSMFSNLSGLGTLNLSYNSFSWTNENQANVGNPLRSFNLRGNKLEGKIPRTLINCKRLKVLDLGNNESNDTFPMWLGTLPNVMVLSLRSNKLHGPIKTSKTKGLFPQLRMIDISSNGFYGDLPTYLFENFQAMKKVDENMKTPSNRFEGSIPSVIRGLTSLVVVNISHNSLEGHIPTSLGSLSELQSLDLSFNKLSGEIPRQLTSLTFLGFLSVSHNHLVGCIPEGNQFGTFPSSSFEGNDGLRGFPLSKDCGDHGQVPPPTIPSALDDQ